MRIFWCGASADWSIADSSNGYRDALIRAGHTVHEFKLARRLINMGGFLGLEANVQNLAKVSLHASRTAVADAVEFEPDWVLISSAMAFHPDAIVLLRRAGMRVGVIFTESPYSDPDHEHVAALCDFVATNDRCSAEKYGWCYLPSAYSPEAHRMVDVAAYNAEAVATHQRAVAAWQTACERLRASWTPQRCRGCGSTVDAPLLPDAPSTPLLIPRHDVVLVGTGWSERVARLKRVDWRGIDFAIYGFWPQLAEQRDNLDYEHTAGIVDDPEGRAVLGRFYTERPTENRETVALYSGAKIVLNDHRMHPDAYSVNPRVFEALAVGGGLLLTDYRPELVDILGGRWPAYTFTDAADLEAKMRYYLAHEDERRELVEYGRARVQGQTFDARVATLLGALAPAGLVAV